MSIFSIGNHIWGKRKKEDCDWNMFGYCVRNRTGIKNKFPFSIYCKKVCWHWIEGPLLPKED